LERAQSLFFNRTLLKMESKLTAEGYAGYVDLKLYREQQRNLSFGIQPRDSAIHHQHSQEGLAYAHQRFFLELATGVEPKWRTRSGFQIGIRIVVPGRFP